MLQTLDSPSKYEEHTKKLKLLNFQAKLTLKSRIKERKIKEELKKHLPKHEISQEKRRETIENLKLIEFYRSPKALDRKSNSNIERLIKQKINLSTL